MKIALFLGVVLFAIMTSLGSQAIETSDDDVPKREVITIEPPPKVYQRTEYVTEYVTVPIPETCLAALELVNVVVNASADVNRIGVKIETEVESITADIMRDPSAVSDYQNFLYKATEKSGEQIIKSMETQLQIDDAMMMCEEDMAAFD